MLCMIFAFVILSIKNRGFGYYFLAFCLPPIGLIVALCLKKLPDTDNQYNNQN